MPATTSEPSPVLATEVQAAAGPLAQLAPKFALEMMKLLPQAASAEPLAEEATDA